MHYWNRLNVFLGVTRGTQKRRNIKAVLKMIVSGTPNMIRPVFQAESNVSLNLNLTVQLLRFILRNDKVTMSERKRGWKRKGLASSVNSGK